MQYRLEIYASELPTPSELLTHLRQRFPAARKWGKRITLPFPGWRGAHKDFEIWLWWRQNESVRERADFLAKKFNRPEIAGLDRQIHVDSFGDLEEQFYNEFVHLTDELYGLKNLHVFDPVLDEFLFA